MEEIVDREIDPQGSGKKGKKIDKSLGLLCLFLSFFPVTRLD
jgi:hypothetical protein